MCPVFDLSIDALQKQGYQLAANLKFYFYHSMKMNANYPNCFNTTWQLKKDAAPVYFRCLMYLNKWFTSNRLVVYQTKLLLNTFQYVDISNFNLTS